MRETDRLTWLVSESVQIARIEAGRMELRKQRQDITQLIEKHSREWRCSRVPAGRSANGQHPSPGSG